MIEHLYHIIGQIDFWIIFKMSLATIVGLLIGKERKRYQKPGGSRTFALVCLGSTMIATIAQLLADVASAPFDMSRMPAYAITGIGFLGGGMILQNKNKVEGITTASTLWAIVPIGLLIGFGYYWLACASGAFIYAILDSKYHAKRSKKRNGKKRKSNSSSKG